MKQGLWVPTTWIQWAPWVQSALSSPRFPWLRDILWDLYLLAFHPLDQQVRRCLLILSVQ